MTRHSKRKYRERKIQKLIRDHPYLLDKELMNLKGRIERTVRTGRVDIDFETEDGWVIVECKITPLANRDVQQLRRYIQDFKDSGKHVHKAYLIGVRPRTELNETLLSKWPRIKVLHLLYAIPSVLAFCEGRHYFDATLETCPYDGAQRIPGKELELRF